MNNVPFKQQIASHYAKLDVSGKTILLAKIAEWLTLDGRATNEPTPERSAERMRTVIEVLHRIVVQLHSMLAELERYPDDVFADVLAEQLDRLKLSDKTMHRLFT